MNDEQIKTAITHYQNHLKAVSKYQKAHPEKSTEKHRRYIENLRENRPEAYMAYKEKRRNYYKKKCQKEENI
jgi:hypothetical protein